MVAARTLPNAADEQRFVLHGVTWRDYVLLRDVLDGPSPKMTYLEGTLELMSPSPVHEVWKKNLARLIELYAYQAGIDLRGYGSTTFKSEAHKRGAEPDECYLVGRVLADYPDFVLEVVHTVPLIDKRGVYAAMGVAEVWLFEEGALTVLGLDRAKSAYAPRERSQFLPRLDPALLATYASREDTLDALREFARECGA